MKKPLFALLLLLLLTSSDLWSQNFYLNRGFKNGNTVTTCSGNFFDSNPADVYRPNENYTVTFSSGNSNKVIQIILKTLSVAAGDTLFSYDGNSINSPVIDTFTNNTQNLVTFTPTNSNTSGSITFRFRSDDENQGTGWVGEIKCILPCKQAISGNTFTLPAKDPEGYTNLCFGDIANFSVKTLYPNNDLTYHQSDSTSSFRWIFGDGKDTTGKNLTSVKHLYTMAGGYYAKLAITDSNGCTNKQLIQFPVRTSMTPVFNITPGSLCMFDTLQIKPNTTINGLGTATSPTGTFTSLPVSGDSVFLPDNPPQCFTSSIIVEQFAKNQRLQNISDLEGIFMNMEHSYLGDVTISIESPNGIKVFLKTTIEGSAGDGTFLGEPVDESLDGAPTDTSLSKIRGKGYNYSFSSTPKYGTMWEEVSRSAYSYTDNGGKYILNHYYLPSGSYKSEESLLPLLGTPLNGKWTLEICDKQAIDNGFVFNWNLKFNKAIFPEAETYTSPIVSQTWLPSPGLISINKTTGYISPTSSGTFPYTFSVKDGFGCSYDTTVKVVVYQIPAKPNLGADTAICTGHDAILQVTNFESSVNYLWSTKQKGFHHINIGNSGVYWLEATNNRGCKSRDTIVVKNVNPFTVNLGNDTLHCTGESNLLTPMASSPISSWKWNSGVSSSSYTATSAGKYWVEAKDAKGCLVSDTIEITENPVNFFEIPKDTSICDRSRYLLTLNPPTGSVIRWNDNTNGYSHVINKAGTYTATANYKGCTNVKSIKVQVLPLPVFSLGRDTTLCDGYDLPLTATYPGATYQWSSGITDSVYIASRSGMYWLEANLNGCTFRDSLVMKKKICQCEIKMPNAFSPNGDGINDVYRPDMKCFPRSFHLSVFNRNGMNVFEAYNYTTLWDGKFSGLPLPVATYYYTLTYFNEAEMQIEKKNGSITLLR